MNKSARKGPPRIASESTARLQAKPWERRESETAHHSRLPRGLALFLVASLRRQLLDVFPAELQHRSQTAFVDLGAVEGAQASLAQRRHAAASSRTGRQHDAAAALCSISLASLAAESLGLLPLLPLLTRVLSSSCVPSSGRTPSPVARRPLQFLRATACRHRIELDVSSQSLWVPTAGWSLALQAGLGRRPTPPGSLSWALRAVWARSLRRSGTGRRGGEWRGGRALGERQRARPSRPRSPQSCSAAPCLQAQHDGCDEAAVAGRGSGAGPPPSRSSSFTVAAYFSQTCGGQGRGLGTAGEGPRRARLSPPA